MYAFDRRILRPGGNKGAKPSTSGDGSQALYDYNGLYEEHLNYTEMYNQEFILNYSEHYKYELARFVICLLIFFFCVVLTTEFYGRN